MSVEFQGPPQAVSRIVHRNRHLNDGTPRREKGYRVFIESIGPAPTHLFVRKSAARTIFQSPLFDRQIEAEGWMPNLNLTRYICGR